MAAIEITRKDFLMTAYSNLTSKYQRNSTLITSARLWTSKRIIQTFNKDVKKWCDEAVEKVKRRWENYIA